MVEYDGVDGGGGAVGKSVKKSSKSRRIVKKSKKPQRSEKFAKAIGSEERLPKHRSSVNYIRGTRASARALTVFRALFARPKNLSRYHVWNNYRQGKTNGAADTLSRFSPEKPRRSSSREYSSLSPAVTSNAFAPKFVCKTHVFPPLLQLWDTFRTLRHQDYSKTHCARPPSTASILEMRSGRRRPSPESA